MGCPDRATEGEVLQLEGFGTSLLEELDKLLDTFTRNEWHWVQMVVLIQKRLRLFARLFVVFGRIP
jgi:hypothetical protein